MKLPDGATIYKKAFIEALQPPLDLRVSEWADTDRYLTRRSTSEPGKWRTDRVPYLREPMDLLSPSEKVIKRVVLMFGSQTAKTEAGLNWLGRTIALDPGPFLVMFPSESFAKRQIRQRFTPLFSDSPAVAARQISKKSRDAANAMFLKEFEGDMLLSIIGGNSGSAAQGMPAQYVWADEVSSLPQEMDDKGDPLENAEARQTNFPDRKTLITSTPGTRGACRITWEYETRSDQRQFAVKMPCCETNLILRWRDHFKWETKDSEVYVLCSSCGARIEEHNKSTMLSGGIWKPTAKGDGETAGFHFPGWYAPYGWLSWEQIRDEFIRATSDSLLLKGWVNKREARAWEENIENSFNAEGLKRRSQDLSAGNGYSMSTIPVGVLVITAGVDVQGGGGTVGERLVVTLWGWGLGEEGWHLGHFEIHGDPQGHEVWEQLDRIEETEWIREDGARLRIPIGGIDDGGLATQRVRDYCRTRPKWVPLKGSGTKGKELIGRGTPVDINKKNQPVRKGSVLLYTVCTDTSITHLQGRLRNETPGPGYLHLGQAATDQFLAELFPWKRRSKTVKGFIQFEWMLPQGEHDEGGDCTRYAYAALQLLARRYARPDLMWSDLERQALATLSLDDSSPRRILDALSFA